MLFIFYVVTFAKFKDTTYSVDEDNREYTVVIEKIGGNVHHLWLRVGFVDITTTGKHLLYHSKMSQN